MRGKLTKQGDALALELDPEITKQLRISLDTPLEVSTDGVVLIVSPIRERRDRNEFQKALLEANNQYGGMLERLAD